LVGDLLYHSVVPKSAGANDDEEEVEEAGERGLVELPCFEIATKIQLKLRYEGLVFHPQGVFDHLTNLSLSCVRFHGPCNLDNAVSKPRCPCLQKLSVLESDGRTISRSVNCYRHVLAKRVFELISQTRICPMFVQGPCSYVDLRLNSGACRP
jgi:hypothetical protein